MGANHNTSRVTCIMDYYAVEEMSLLPLRETRLSRSASEWRLPSPQPLRRAQCILPSVLVSFVSLIQEVKGAITVFQVIPRPLTDGPITM